jgi:branched-chain amino acid transport system permease protein
MGINANRVIVLTFVVGAALAGVAGVMYGLWLLSIKGTMGFLPGIKAFTAAVLGGIGNIPGAMLGGLLIGLSETIGREWLNELFVGLATNGRTVAFFVLILLASHGHSWNW